MLNSIEYIKYLFKDTKEVREIKIYRNYGYFYIQKKEKIKFHIYKDKKNIYTIKSVSKNYNLIHNEYFYNFLLDNLNTDNIDIIIVSGEIIFKSYLLEEIQKRSIELEQYRNEKLLENF